VGGDLLEGPVAFSRALSEGVFIEAVELGHEGVTGLAEGLEGPALGVVVAGEHGDIVAGLAQVLGVR
jgi:hypothetical protein